MWNWFLSLFKKKDAIAPTARSPEPVASPSAPLIFPAPPIAPGTVAVTRPSDLPPSNHYASRNRSLMETEYVYLWPMAAILPDWRVKVERVVDWAVSNRASFEEIAAQTRIPWWLVAGINNLEMGMSFNGTILNGDPWGQPTKHYPPGLGPWQNWSQACLWGLRHEAKGWGFDLVKWNWTVGSTFYFGESYNGHGARLDGGSAIIPPNASPYIYSGTQFYVSGKTKEMESPPGSGKYKSVFDPLLVSDQVGLMAFARGLANAGEKLF